jgi:ParB/RepB/Spo0J family partition protein
MELKERNDSCQYELINGQRRWLALGALGIKKMKVIVREVKNVEEQFLVSVLTNFCAADISPWEVAKAIARFKNNGMTIEAIRKAFGKSSSWVQNHARFIDDLTPEVQAMMSPKLPEDQRLPSTSALLVADVPRHLQRKVAETIVKKSLKLVETKEHIRKLSKKHGFGMGNPDRTPNKDYNVLLNFLAKVEREANALADNSEAFFKKVFESRNKADIIKVLDGLDKSMEKLKKLRGLIASAKE